MRVGVIADDLTGANATGVKLSKQGLFAVTFLGNGRIPYNEKEMAVCIDTDSRYVSFDTSKKRVQESLGKLQDWNTDLICKRIDSTFRGNIGQELDTILDTLYEDAAIVMCPSYPASGRMTIGGYLLVDNQLIQVTDIANDPIQPIKSSFVPKLVEDQSDRDVGLISIHQVEQGGDVIRSEIERYISKGHQIIVCDAISEKNINDVAYAMSQIKHAQLIPADPGPLTNAYIRHTNNKNVHPEADFLLTIGSVTSLTTKQIEYLLSELKIEPVIVRPAALATLSSSWEEEVNRAVRETEKLLKKQSFLVVTTNSPEQKLVDLNRIAATENVSKDLLAKRITEGLAEISRKIILKSNQKIDKCFFSGGDVTASFCERVGAEGIDLKGEVMPLAAYGELLGGEFNGLSVITKGGMVGSHTAILDSIKYMQSLAKRR